MVSGWLRFGKKADFGLGSMILVLLVIIAMATVSPRILEAFEGKKDTEICKASVSVKAISIKLTSLGTKLVDPTQLNFDCHTARYPLVVKKDGTYQNGEIVTKFGEGEFADKGYEDKLKTVIAGSMAQCWDMFHRGEIDPFTVLDGTEHCVMCYDVVFDKDAKDELQKESQTQALSDFNGFLLTSYYNAKETYSQFIYGIGPNDVKAADFVKEENSPEFDVGTQYAVIFYSSRGGSFDGAIDNAVKILGNTPQGLLAKLVAFVVTKPADVLIHNVGVVTIPLNDVADRCARLY